MAVITSSKVIMFSDYNIFLENKNLCFFTMTIINNKRNNRKDNIMIYLTLIISMDMINKLFGHGLKYDWRTLAQLAMTMLSVLG